MSHGRYYRAAVAMCSTEAKISGTARRKPSAYKIYNSSHDGFLAAGGWGGGEVGQWDDGTMGRQFWRAVGGGG